jgi:hypothetical protein
MIVKNPSPDSHVAVSESSPEICTIRVHVVDLGKGSRILPKTFDISSLSYRMYGVSFLENAKPTERYAGETYLLRRDILSRFPRDTHMVCNKV